MLSKMRRSITTFFNPDIATKKLHLEIKAQRMNIGILKDEYLNLSSWHNQYVSTLSMLTNVMEAMVWKKDKNHSYLLANPIHCMSFFGFDATSECLSYVEGKDDIDIIKELYLDKGMENSFGDVCVASDAYVSKAKSPVHFLEAGIVEGEELLFYSVKTPQFTDSGEFIGTIGIAWDMTEQASFLVEQLNRWIYAKNAMKVFHKKKSFCYSISPDVRRCQIFHHICPVPERGKACEDRCDICTDKED